MIHVLVRVSGSNDLEILKVRPAGTHYGLVDGAKYVHLGKVSKVVSVRGGFTVHEWIAHGDGDLFQVRAGTRKKAVELLLERYGMVSVSDVDTIPALF